MKNNIKSFVLGFMACAAISTTTVFATDSTPIDVYFKKLKYVFNGIEKAPASTEQGFIYQGTTYVPLRFVSESLDKELRWDGDTGTISISNKAGEFVMEDLSITDNMSSSVIQLGMSQDEVELKLGKPTDVNFMNMYNYNGLQVYYRDHKVVGLIVKASENTTNRYRTSKNLGLGSSLNEVFSQYGNGKVDEEFHAVTYLFDYENEKLIKNDARSTFTDGTSSYAMSISYFENSNKTIGMILIGDYTFTYLTK
jgi:hypothetical protein